MKIKSVVYSFVIVVVFVILAISCKKGNDANNLTPNIPAPDGTVTDIEGNVYPTMKIGTQSLMVENLRVTKFNDNTAIPLVTNATDWKILFTPGYCWYNNDPATNKNIYGALYNWFTVNTGKLCPTGWHVPTDAEWITLTTYLGNVNAGGKLKETGTTHWLVLTQAQPMKAVLQLFRVVAVGMMEYSVALLVTTVVGGVLLLLTGILYIGMFTTIQVW